MLLLLHKSVSFLLHIVIELSYGYDLFSVWLVLALCISMKEHNLLIKDTAEAKTRH